MSNARSLFRPGWYPSEDRLKIYCWLRISFVILDMVEFVTYWNISNIPTFNSPEWLLSREAIMLQHCRTNYFHTYRQEGAFVIGRARVCDWARSGWVGRVGSGRGRTRQMLWQRPISARSDICGCCSGGCAGPASGGGGGFGAGGLWRDECLLAQPDSCPHGSGQ